MSHYVVTGGAGFIGSAIVRRLLQEGARKVGFGLLCDARPEVHCRRLVMAEHEVSDAEEMQVLRGEGRIEAHRLLDVGQRPLRVAFIDVNDAT